MNEWKNRMYDPSPLIKEGLEREKHPKRVSAIEQSRHGWQLPIAFTAVLSPVTITAVNRQSASVTATATAVSSHTTPDPSHSSD